MAAISKPNSAAVTVFIVVINLFCLYKHSSNLEHRTKETTIQVY